MIEKIPGKLVAGALIVGGVPFDPNAGGGTPSVSGMVLLSSTLVNLAEGTAAKQALYTCPASRKAIVTNWTFHSLSDTEPANNVTITLGWDAGATNIIASPVNLSDIDFMDTKVILGAAVDTDHATGYLLFNAKFGNAGDVLGLKVTDPSGIPLTMIVDIFGYLTNVAGVPQNNILVP